MYSAVSLTLVKEYRFIRIFNFIYIFLVSTLNVLYSRSQETRVLKPQREDLAPFPNNDTVSVFVLFTRGSFSWHFRTFLAALFSKSFWTKASAGITFSCLAEQVAFSECYSVVTALQTCQTRAYLQRGVFWFLGSDVFMLPVHLHIYGPQALFSVRRDVCTLRGLVHQRIRSLQLFHVPQRHQWNHRFANVRSFFRVRIVEDKDVQVLEDGKECNQHECTCAIQPRNAVVHYTAQRSLTESHEKKKKAER